MTDKSETLQALIPIFRNVLEAPDLQIDFDTSATDVPEWDSLNHATLMATVQEHFSVRFALRDILALHSVGDLCDLVLRAKQG